MPTAHDLDELDLDLHGLARLGLLGELQLPGRIFPTAARARRGTSPVSPAACQRTRQLRAARGWTGEWQGSYAAPTAVINARKLALIPPP